MRFVYLAAVSIISGAIGGMGIGGGVILIPVLTAVFGIAQKQAQFVNLLYFVPVALCALFVHSRAGRVEWRKALYMAIGGVCGALVGTYLAKTIGDDILKRIFGVFLLVVGIRQFKTLKTKNNSVEE